MFKISSNTYTFHNFLTLNLIISLSHSNKSEFFKNEKTQL